MIVAYVSGHGYGHLTRLCEVLRALRLRDPAVPITVVGAVPPALVDRGIGGPVDLREVACDVGLVQKDALEIDEPATAARCRAFEATWDRRIAAEAAFLRERRARIVIADVPALAFAAAERAGARSFAHGNFSWDWIYRHLSLREPSLADSAERAAAAYARADLLLELPFAGDLGAFPRRERIGFVARRPVVDKDDARRRLGLDGRPAVLLSFGGIGLPALLTGSARARRDPSFQWLDPSQVTTPRLDALGLSYPDVVGAADVVVTKPGYGIVSDAIGARTRLVYTDRGDFPEYEVMVQEMPRYLPCAYVPRTALLDGAVSRAVHEVLARPMPEMPDVRGAARAAERLLGSM